MGTALNFATAFSGPSLDITPQQQGAAFTQGVLSLAGDMMFAAEGLRVATSLASEARAVSGVASEGRGLIGMVKPSGIIDPSLQSAYTGIANSSEFSASLARYNSFARAFGLTETAGVAEINSALASNTTFARTSNIQAG